MLAEIRIRDFAIIDQLELQFTSGLTTFTGETGAGKSIIIDAVETLLGSRVEATMIRAGKDRAVIEGVFRISEALREPLVAILTREDLLDDPNFLALGREIRRKGRHVARINGRSVSVALLREVGEYLVDVHGQSEHLSLLRVPEHLRLLDGFADVAGPLAAYQKVYHRLRQVRRDLETLHAAERDAARRTDLLNYQINEIESANLRPGEEGELRQEHLRLASAETLTSLVQEALFALDDGDPETQPVTDLFGRVMRALQTLARTDPSLEPVRERVDLMAENLAELARDLRRYREGIEFNPRRLTLVEERLELLQTLKRKYGETVAEVLAFAQAAREELETISHAEERIAGLETEESRLLRELAALGMTLSQKRHAAAESLSQALETELDQLHMEGARFRVQFRTRPDPEGVELADGQRVKFNAHGLESVEFLVAPNPGEGLKPLVKIASGGETSRLMLALKNVLAQADRTPTLIFDEIDQGIGGRVGAIVGKKLAKLAQQHQVFCITHLPQLAAFGSEHYRVEKLVAGGRTTTRVVRVQGEARLQELAQMMGEVSSTTLQSAQEILQLASR